ncbi:MAG TPA: ATP-binding protein [Sphingomonadaceae bacterium]
MKLRLWPHSLLGQMLLAVALALLVAQAISAALLLHAQDVRREMGAANGLTFQLVAEPRFDYRDRQGRLAGDPNNLHWQRLRVERTTTYPLHPGEARDPKREQLLRTILAEQGIEPVRLVVTTRAVSSDPYVMQRLRDRQRWRTPPPWANGQLIVAGLMRKGASDWTVARVPVPQREPGSFSGIIGQTLILYVVLVGGLAFLLRRITRPLADLTERVAHFANTREIEGQLEPAGPEDTRRLIEAHNAMEARISALLDEKDVMLGAIGHDLKTPLAALRVRIESVEDDTERARMAASIEDITRTLDDILSLARVGRPSDQPENTELAALVASVVEEFEDMGEDVELGGTARIALPVRTTWLRRALRNLVGNALRYGGKARVSLLREPGKLIVRVDDDGPGIPDGEIAAMLEPFRRGDPSRSKGTGGAGLGLTLARAIAEQHGGCLKLANRHGPDGEVAGLRAEIRLPGPA